MKELENTITERDQALTSVKNMQEIISTLTATNDDLRENNSDLRKSNSDLRGHVDTLVKLEERLEKSQKMFEKLFEKREHLFEQRWDEERKANEDRVKYLQKLIDQVEMAYTQTKSALAKIEFQKITNN